MKILTFNKNSAGQNIYLCWCENTNEGVLIDAGCSVQDENAIIKAVKDNNIVVKAILLTHGHFDHIIAVTKMKNLLGAMVYCHVSEKQVLEDPELNLSCYTASKTAVTPDGLFNDSDIFQFGECAFKVLHTPGHTPGGACYYNEKSASLFVGDTLFKRSVGRTDFPRGDHAKLVRNISAKLLPLPDETVVFPGHGDNTSIGIEKKSNPFL